MAIGRASSSRMRALILRRWWAWVPISFGLHPTRVIKLLTELKEHQEYLRTRKDKQPQGRRIFRDCHEACPAMRAVTTNKPGADVLLVNACRICHLKAAPSAEVRRVVELAPLPDASIDFGRLPYWLAHGIGVYRTMNRGGF